MRKLKETDFLTIVIIIALFIMIYFHKWYYHEVQDVVEENSGYSQVYFESEIIKDQMGGSYE